MRRWYWYRGRLYRRLWCLCGHEHLLHMGLTGRCLHPVEPHPALCDCTGFRRPAQPVTRTTPTEEPDHA